MARAAALLCPPAFPLSSNAARGRYAVAFGAVVLGLCAYHLDPDAQAPSGVRTPGRGGDVTRPLPGRYTSAASADAARGPPGLAEHLLPAKPPAGSVLRESIDPESQHRAGTT